MKKYECEPCGYIYDEAAGDPDNGIAPGTKFEDLPEDWVCPLCGMGKEVFSETEERGIGECGQDLWRISKGPVFFLYNRIDRKNKNAIK